MNTQVAIVGAGLSGLACALTLQEQGVEVLVLDAAPQVGGRVRSVKQDGYTMDVGFQVLLTGYPEARKWLDYAALELRCFPAGALVHKNQVWHTYADPLRQPGLLWETLRSPVGTVLDKLRLAWLRARLWIGDICALEGETTYEFLGRWGFSKAMIDDFFSPFFGGVFLESELRTSARKFLYLFHLFSTSRAAVPASGMGAIPAQMAQRLQQAPLLSTRVEALDGTKLITTAGTITAECVVLAGADPEMLHGRTTEFHSAFTYYFTCPEDSTLPKMLMLDADPGPINNIAPLSRVAPYAPAGRELVAVSVLGQARTSIEVESSLFRLWPADWEFLRHFEVAKALPIEDWDLMVPPQLDEGVYRCGDHCSSGSIQGALESGRRTASALLANQAWKKAAVHA